MPPFLLGDSYGDARMGMARILGLCFAFLFASSVGAAVTIDLGPSDYRNLGSGVGSHTAGGVKSSFGQTVRMPPTMGTLSVTRNPIVPYGSIGTALRTLGRTTPAAVAASAAINGLFIGMEWAFSDGEWKKYEEGLFDDLTFGLWTINTSTHGSFSGPTPDYVCESYVAAAVGSNGYPVLESVRINSETSIHCRGYRCAECNIATLATGNRTANCPVNSEFDAGRGVCVVDGEWVVLTDADYNELTQKLPSLPAQDVVGAAGDAQDLLGGPLSGYSDSPITGPSSFTGPETTSTSTDPVTGDTIVTNTSTTTNISYGDTTITTSTTTTATTYQNGQETSTTVTTETPGELPVDGGGGLPPAGEWPGFCDWATVVCDWLNWTQEEPPPDVDLPQVIDDDFFNEKTISFGAKSCPPDHEINLTPFLETTVGVSFQPLCDFASLIYYMVMAASYIIAAYISIGVARNG